MEINLDEMNLSELKALSKRVSQAIESFEARRLSEARDAVEALAKELGYSLSALAQLETKATRRPAAAKYQHPENPEITWSGRGRQPRWVAAVLASGGSLEGLAVAG